MSFEPAVLLELLAGRLRDDIAPSIGDEYLRTQSYMAAVITERLARQVALGEQHAAAEAADMAQLVQELDRIGLGSLTDELPALRADTTVTALGDVVAALYRADPERPEAVAALAVIRRVLRRDIDRRMEIAR